MEREQLFVEIQSRIDVFETGIPLHKKLKMALQELIVNNSMRRGSTLPGERTMAEALSLSRVTVRKAIELLIETFGVHQLVYGSDTPVIEAGATLRSVRGFGQAVADAVCQDNPGRLFGREQA